MYLYCMIFSCFFFFFKQKTAYEMRISDWSSDVCSSDLHAFSLSFTALAGAKVSFLDAAILMVSPVAGFRPSRAAVSLTLNLPKPLREISSPPAAAWAIAANTASTVLRASALLRPDSAASLSARSLLFMQKTPVVLQWFGEGLDRKSTRLNSSH